MKLIKLTAVALLSAITAFAVVQDVAAKETAKDSGKSGPVDVKPEIIDINSATVKALEKLKGIGPARAADIVKGRPYTGKDDLVKRNIVSQEVYDGIKEGIVARRPLSGNEQKTQAQ
jgi:competence protein ComEA